MTEKSGSKILILTEPIDPHADRVGEQLKKQGADFVRFNPQDFPSKAEISLFYSPTGQADYRLRFNQKSIDLKELKAVWYRRPQPPVAHEEITEPDSRDLVAEESHTVVKDLWNSLDCLWLPAHPFVIQRAQLRASQLQVAGALGFELPPTLLSNSPEDFLEFYRQHNGKVVSKMAGVSFSRRSPVSDTFCRYTEVVSKRDVGYAQAVRYCPMIFQAYVPKRFELRITVVGEQVFTAEIHSQETNHTRHDWRRYNHHKTLYRRHELPPDVQQRCLCLVERLGLCYGAIDMILTPDGRYVFLEINPNGQYLWIEEATGLPISKTICALLLSGQVMDKPAEYLPPSHSGGFQ